MQLYVLPSHFPSSSFIGPVPVYIDPKAYFIYIYNMPSDCWAGLFILHDIETEKKMFLVFLLFLFLLLKEGQKEKEKEASREREMG